MSYSRVEGISDGAQTSFSIPFSYLSSANVKLYIDGVLDVTGRTLSWPSPGTVVISTPVDTGAAYSFRRSTMESAPAVTFNSGSFHPSDANRANLQLLYLAQETSDAVAEIGGDTAALDASVAALSILTAANSSAITALQAAVAALPGGGGSDGTGLLAYTQAITSLRSRSNQNRWTEHKVQMLDYITQAGSGVAGDGAKAYTAAQAATAGNYPLELGAGPILLDNLVGGWTASFGVNSQSNKHFTMYGQGPDTVFKIPADVAGVVVAGNPIRFQQTGPTGTVDIGRFTVDGSAVTPGLTSALLSGFYNNNFNLSSIDLLSVPHAGMRWNGDSWWGRFRDITVGEAWSHSLALSGDETNGSSGFGPRPKYISVGGLFAKNREGSAFNAAGVEGLVDLNGIGVRDLSYGGYIDAYAYRRWGNATSDAVLWGHYTYGYYRAYRITDGNRMVIGGGVLRRTGNVSVMVNWKDGNGGPMVMSNIVGVEPFANTGWPAPIAGGEDSDDPNDAVGFHVVACQSLVMSNIIETGDQLQQGMGVLTTTAGTTTVTCRQDNVIGNHRFCLDRRTPTGVAENGGPCYLTQRDGTLIGKLISVDAKQWYDVSDVLLVPADYVDSTALEAAAAYALQVGHLETGALLTQTAALWSSLAPNEMSYMPNMAGTISVNTANATVTGTSTLFNTSSGGNTKLKAGDWVVKSPGHELLGVLSADPTTDTGETFVANSRYTYSGAYSILRPKLMAFGFWVRDTASKVHVNWDSITSQGHFTAPGRFDPAAISLECIPMDHVNIAAHTAAVSAAENFGVNIPIKGGQWPCRAVSVEVTFMAADAGDGTNYDTLQLRRYRKSTAADTQISTTALLLNNAAVVKGATLSMALPASPSAANECYLPGDDVFYLQLNKVGTGRTLPALMVVSRFLPWL